MVNNALDSYDNCKMDCRIPILELADLIQSELRSNGRIVHTAPVTDDPQRRRPNIELAKAKLKWKPTVSVRLEMHSMID